MKKYYHPYLKPIARNLRKSMTREEIILWRRLRKKQIYNFQFYRQKPLGSYIVDFYCPAKRLVIEIDGGQHYRENDIKNDKERDKYLKTILKLRVIRFTNLDVSQNIDGVFERILETMR